MGHDQILHINLFGGFRLTDEGKMVSAINTPRLKELLAWLILHRESPQSREYISFLLWPGCTERRAKANLRALLHRLRKTLPKADQFLKIDHKSLQWNTEGQFTLDVAEFEELVSQANKTHKRGVNSRKKTVLTQAADLYGGPLLPECYAEWIEHPRQILQQKYNEVLQELIDLLEQERNYEHAIRYAKKWVQSEPYNEPAWRQLMQLYAWNNDRANALNSYNECKALLNNELDIEPDTETQQVYERLKESYSAKKAKITEPVILKANQEWALVGRKKEWKNLFKQWKQALAGSVECVLIEGEPGIGKSRLGFEFLTSVHKQGYTTAYSRSYEAGGTLSYGPVTDWLRSDLIYRLLSELDPVWLTELIRLVPEIQQEHPDLSPPGPLHEPWQHKRFFEAITRAMLIGHKPRMLVIDDLQWCDGETLDWLNHLIHYDPKAKLMVLGMLRPVEAAANKSLQHLINDLQHKDLLLKMSLSPLDESETMKLAGEIADQQFTSDYTSILYQETEGNPLFVIESIREGFYQDRHKDMGAVKKADSQLYSRLPKKVTEVIASRLEQLSQPTHQIMGLAAAIGKEFSFDIMALACGREEADLIDNLEELMRHYIIREKQDGTFDFTHDKLREVAYKTMTHTRRRWLHRRIAQALEKKNKNRIEEASSGIAFHYDRALVTQEAISYYDIAAQHARDMFANRDALNFLNRAIELMERLPDTEDKNRLQKSVYTKLAIIVMQSKGTGYPRLFEACESVHQACTRLDEPTLAPILRLQAIGRLITGDLESSLSIGEQLYHRAKKEENQVLLTEAYYVIGSTHFWNGNFTESQAYFEEGIDTYRSENEQYHIHHFGQNPYLVYKIRLSLLYWIMGEVNKSEIFRNEAFNYAEEMEHPYSLDYVRYTGALLYSLQQNIRKTKDTSKIILSSSSEFEFPYWHSFAEILYGWSIAQLGNTENGIELMRKGISDLEAINTKLQKPYYIALLAELIKDKGEFDESISLINEAIQQIEDRGEHWIASELYRKKGEILIKKDPELIREATKCFKKAFEIARKQGARLFQNRATDCLKRIDMIKK